MANEQRLIDANKAIADMNQIEINHPYDDKEGILETCVNLLYNCPTVDAVEVVRCKDCKYQCTDSCPTWYEDRMTYRDSWSLDSDDDFCSYGERRTDNEG